ncbi:Protein sel-1 homolog 2 [Galdieria sulphuraria]|nr:Protein sel-1 homolog 2 [Galdieria sulphuraria]
MSMIHKRNVQSHSTCIVLFFFIYLLFSSQNIAAENLPLISNLNTNATLSAHESPQPHDSSLFESSSYATRESDSIDQYSEQAQNFTILGKNFGKARMIGYGEGQYEREDNVSLDNLEREPPLKVLIDGSQVSKVYVHNDTAISFMLNSSRIYPDSVIEVLQGEKKTARIPISLIPSSKTVPLSKEEEKDWSVEHISNSTHNVYQLYSRLLELLTTEQNRNRTSYFEQGVDYLNRAIHILQDQQSPLGTLALLKDPMNEAKRLALLSVESFILGSIEGDDGCMVTLGALYLSGLSDCIPQNLSISYLFLAKAADYGNPDAQALLGIIFASSFSNTLLHSVDMEPKSLWTRVRFLSNWFSRNHITFIKNTSVLESLNRLRSGFFTNHLKELLELESEQKYTIALLLWTFAAEGGSDYAQSALGFRYLYGIGVPRDCIKSVYYYKRAAWQTIRQSFIEPYISSLSPFNAFFVNITSEKDVGLSLLGRPSLPYSSGEVTLLFNHEAWIKDRQATNDIIEYKYHEAENNDGKSELFLGELFLSGAYGVSQDFERAAEYFERASLHGYPQANTLLGVFSLFGLASREKNETVAWELFHEAAQVEDAQAYNAIGYCYYYGIGTLKNISEAVHWFREAASKGSVDALYNLGMLSWKGLDEYENIPNAYSYFLKASKHGHSHATYRLGELVFSEPSVIVTGDRCTKAALYFKYVAQRGRPTYLMSRAFRAMSIRDYGTALLRYVQAALAGVETAQYNAAYMYEHGLGLAYGGKRNIYSKIQYWKSRLGFHSSISSKDLAIYQNAHYYYRLSARQGNPYSQLKIGDLFYDGYLDNNHSLGYRKAAEAYFKATEMGNAEASFNLGYMYFKGIGFARDFHLAKRYYDTSVNLYPEGMVPVQIALRILDWFQMFHHLVGIISQRWLTSKLLLSHLSKALEMLSHWMSLSVLMVVSSFTWWIYRRMFS